MFVALLPNSYMKIRKQLTLKAHGRRNREKRRKTKCFVLNCFSVDAQDFLENP